MNATLRLFMAHFLLNTLNWVRVRETRNVWGKVRRGKVRRVSRRNGGKCKSNFPWCTPSLCCAGCDGVDWWSLTWAYLWWPSHQGPEHFLPQLCKPPSLTLTLNPSLYLYCIPVPTVPLSKSLFPIPSPLYKRIMPYLSVPLPLLSSSSALSILPLQFITCFSAILFKISIKCIKRAAEFHHKGLRKLLLRATNLYY